MGTLQLPLYQWFLTGVIRSPWGLLTMSGNISYCHNWEEELPSDQRPGLLLNILQCTEPPPQYRIIQNVTSTVTEKPWSTRRTDHVSVTCKHLLDPQPGVPTVTALSVLEVGLLLKKEEEKVPGLYWLGKPRTNHY